jgi:hypothetical protein
VVDLNSIKRWKEFKQRNFQNQSSSQEKNFDEILSNQFLDQSSADYFGFIQRACHPASTGPERIIRMDGKC